MKFVPSINEYDVFAFVFHPETLSDEKKEYIETGAVFQEELNYFNMLFNETNKDITENDRQNLASRIAVYQPSSNIIYLYPYTPMTPSKGQAKVLYRAASMEADETVSSKTFMDSSKSFLIKVNTSRNSTSIYIFDFSGKVLKNINLKIFPSESTHHLDDNTQALVLPGKVDISHISLEME